MTTPPPEERELALSLAGNPIGQGSHTAEEWDTVSCTLLAFAAENATLREHIREARACSQRNGVAWNILGAALAQQPKETTQMRIAPGECVHGVGLCPKDGKCNPKPEPYRPKVGERARLDASPCDGDFEFLGCELEILDVRSPRDPHYLPREHYACRAASVYPDKPLRVDIHRDATWSRVASDPVAAEKPTGEPYAAQREGWQKHIERHSTTLEAYQAARTDGFEAGRASEAAAHEETQAMLEKSRAYADSEHARAERFKDDLEKYREDWEDTANGIQEKLTTALAKLSCSESECARERTELERVRGELVRVTAMRQETEYELAALREGRPEPDDEELAKRMRDNVVAEDVRTSGDPDDCADTWEQSCEYHREHWRSVARTAKSLLLGARPRGVVDRESLSATLRAAWDEHHARSYRYANETVWGAQADAVLSALGARVVPTVEQVGRLLIEVTAEPANITDAAKRFIALFAAPDVGEKDSRPTGQKEGSDGERNEYGGDDSAAGSDRPRERGPHDSAPGHGNHDRRAEERAQVAGAQHRDHEARGSSDVGRRSDVQRPDVGSTGVAPAAGEKKGHLQPNEPPDPLPDDDCSHLGIFEDGTCMSCGVWFHRPRRFRQAEWDSRNPWNYSAPPDSEIGESHDLLRDDASAARLYANDLPEVERRTYKGRSPNGFPAWDYREMGPGLSVKAWRRAQQAKPDLPGGHGPTKPLEERIEALESLAWKIEAWASAKGFSRA